jgi:hypothetical protein
MTKPRATVNVDVDPVDLHLIGYGFPGLPPDPLVYSAALPRLQACFDRFGVRATFFVVGRDADAHAGALARLAASGHEIASHSQTHPMALASLSDADLSRELEESKRRLEASSGQTILGYRSPNFDMNERALALLAAAGYAYDASAYPTPLLLAARLLLATKSRDARGVLRLGLRPFTWQRAPHVRQAGARRLHEFPVSVTPFARWPVYHTLRYGMSDARFARVLDGFCARGETLSYPLHAVDALGLDEDRVDRRLAAHPGMNRSLEEKLALLERTVQAIAERFDARTFRDRLTTA